MIKEDLSIALFMFVEMVLLHPDTMLVDVAPEVKAKAERIRRGKSAFGLKWRNVGSEKPQQGVERVNAELTEQLQQRTEFTQAEWDRFGVSDLDTHDYVLAGGAYFQPTTSDRPEGMQLGHLTREEFLLLFDILPLPLNRAQQEQLYMQCDVDNSGTMSFDEFAAGFSAIQASMVSAFLSEVGLSPTQIMAMVMLAILALLAIFVFLFVALSAWTNGDALESVMQSVFVALGGGVFSLSKESSFLATADKVKNSNFATCIKLRFSQISDSNRKNQAARMRRAEEVAVVAAREAEKEAQEKAKAAATPTETIAVSELSD